MIRCFADRATEHIFYGEDSKAARRLPKVLWPLVRRKLDLLHGVSSPKDLAVVPGDRLESLRGDQAGRHSIRVNDQYRITFRFEADGAWEVRGEDYH